MSGGDWWSDYGADDGQSQYDPAQTAATQNQLDPNTTYQPPGQSSPIDQYNYVPDPNAPGGYQQYAPGIAAPDGAQSFSNSTGQYPNDQSMANAIGNNQAYVQPTVDLNGFAGMSQQDQNTWNSQYGSAAAPYQWGLQNGQFQMPGGTEGFLNLPADQQNTWYGTYGADAPMIWQQQQNGASGGIGGFSNVGQMGVGQWSGGQYGVGNFNYGASQGPYPSWMGGGGTPWNNQASIGAGTSEIPYGWGVPGFGQSPIQINSEILKMMQNPEWMKANMPGYIPGSGTYNQYRLDQGGLIGNVMGQPTNLRYGQGGTGDPTTGREVQTPDQIVQGPKLFNSTRTSNWGQGDQAGTGLDYIATLFLRPDTPSGINTAAWSAPPQMWQGLGQQIANGQIQPTKEGWAVLAQKGLTPQSIGGAAPQQAQQAGYGGAGAAGGGTGPMGAGTQAFNYQAAYLDYMTAMMNNVQIPGMKNQNQQAQDQLAFEQAKQKWLEQYQNQVFGEGQRQFDVNTGLQQGQLTGMYNGQETLGKQQLNQQTSLNYLQLLAGLRGPGDIFQYMKVLNGTPGGIKDIVNAAAGAYRMPATGGGATVGGYSNGANLDTLLGQMNNPNFGAEGQNLNLPPPNQLNAQSLLRMTPSQQQMLMGAYESAGYRPEDVQAIFRNSMPRYSSQGSAGRVGLF